MSGVPVEELVVLTFPAGAVVLEWVAASWRRNLRGRAGAPASGGLTAADHLVTARPG